MLIRSLVGEKSQLLYVIDASTASSEIWVTTDFNGNSGLERQKGWMIVHFRLRKRECEAISRMAASGPQ